MSIIRRPRGHLKTYKSERNQRFPQMDFYTQTTKEILYAFFLVSTSQETFDGRRHIVVF